MYFYCNRLANPLFFFSKVTILEEKIWVTWKFLDFIKGHLIGLNYMKRKRTGLKGQTSEKYTY